VHLHLLPRPSILRAALKQRQSENNYMVAVQWGKISLTVITLLALQNSVEWKARQLSCILPFIWPSDFEVPLFVITAHFPAGESEL
jgi:hypothetical protein